MKLVEAEWILPLYGCAVDLRSETVMRGGGSVTGLSTKEAMLLRYLSERPSQIVPVSELLQEVWGYTAAARSRAVSQTVSRLRDKIEVDRQVPAHIITLKGHGYRFEPRRPAPSTTSARTNLERRDDAFFGRTDVMEALQVAFHSGTRLVTLRGTAGLGKTRAALEFGWVRLDGSDLAHAWFCDLREATTVAGLLAVVAQTLEVNLERQDEGDQISSLGAALGEQGEVLLILDNFEQLPLEAAHVVEMWHDLADELHLLVTSRHRLRVDTETLLDLQPLTDGNALALFRNRADIDHLSRSDESALIEVVDLLDRMPLAIELASAWCGVLSIAQIRRGLEDRFDLLTDGDRSGPHASLAAALDTSWELLSESERSALRQCATFRGGSTLQAAEAILILPEGAPWTLAVLRSLRNKSLILRSRGNRFTMYESIREYAAVKLLEADEAAEVELRHRDWFLERAVAWNRDLDRREDADTRALMRADIDNIYAVYHRAIDEDATVATRIALSLETYLHHRGPVRDLSALLVRALGKQPIDTEHHGPQRLGNR